MGKGKDEAAIRKSAESQNLPLPDWIQNKPVLGQGLEFYYMAFIDLNSCRIIGMGEGPIPWTAIHQYAVKYDIYDAEFDRFLTIITNMDHAYLTERNKK
jgi:hypothetical protein